MYDDKGGWLSVVTFAQTPATARNSKRVGFIDIDLAKHANKSKVSLRGYCAVARSHGPHQHSERLLIQGAIFNGGLKVTIQIRRASTPLKSNFGDSPQLYVLAVLYQV